MAHHNWWSSVFQKPLLSSQKPPRGLAAKRAEAAEGLERPERIGGAHPDEEIEWAPASRQPASSPAWLSWNFPFWKRNSVKKLRRRERNQSRGAHSWNLLPPKSKVTPDSPRRKKERVFTDVARNTAICIKIIKSLGMEDLPQVALAAKKLGDIAKKHQEVVLETILKYFRENTQLAVRHRFRILQVLEIIVTKHSFLSQQWAQACTRLALENMVLITDLEEVYQNAASDLLVAVWSHASKHVTPQLLKMFWDKEFPHRSAFYTLGKIISKDWAPDSPEHKEWECQLFQVGEMSVHLLTEKAWMAELDRAITKCDWSILGQSLEKASLYAYYGVMLRASNNGHVVRERLSALLGTSHQCLFQREGIALTIGLTATRHLTITCAVLEDFGKTMVTGEKTPVAKMSQCLEDIHWKWASSTVLLCYGHMACRSKDIILALADGFASRMVGYFQCSHWDGPFKKSFLTSILMLVGAIASNKDANSYMFFQKSQLILCLMKLIEKEPRDTLCTLDRQKALVAVAGLSKLKPPLQPKERSDLLYTCFQSLFTLPLLETLERHSCLMVNPPSIKDLYRDTMSALDQMLQGLLWENPSPNEAQYILEQISHWMNSRKSHERQRAVRTSTILLKFVVERFSLAPAIQFSRMGHLVGMLGMLCGDPEEATRTQAMEAVFYLYNVMLRQKGLRDEAEAHLKMKKRCPMTVCSPDQELGLESFSSLSSFQIVKAFGEQFEPWQLRDLLGTLLDGLCGPIHFRAQTAAQMLYVTFEIFGNQLEEVSNIGKRVYLQLCFIRTLAVKQEALRAISVLVREHTRELVGAFLEYSVSMDRHVVELWRAVGSEPHISPRVLLLLLEKLEERPSLEQICQIEEETYPESLAAMNTLYEMLFVPEYQEALHAAYPRLFFALVTQIHYIFDLDLLDEDEVYWKGHSGQRALVATPCRCPWGRESGAGSHSAGSQDLGAGRATSRSTSVEAVKSLFSKNGFWQEFAFLELQEAWDQLAGPLTYCNGVCLLARAMVEFHSPRIPGILLQALTMIQKEEDRQRMVAMIFFTEFLRSPAMANHLARHVILGHLTRGIRDPNLVVRVASLHGFSIVFLNPEKGDLLRAQVPAFLDALFDANEKALVSAICALSEVLYKLGKQGPGALSLDIALNLQAFFDDERQAVRGAAISAFGNLVGSLEDKEPEVLKDQVCRTLIPLFFHFLDEDKSVVKKAKLTFFRCASFLQWDELGKLFRRLAWEDGLRGLHSVWKCFMENMIANTDLFLSQALGYVWSNQWTLRMAAALFIGHTVHLLPMAISKILDQKGAQVLLHAFYKLQHDEEEFIRQVAKAHIVSLQKVAQLV
ncbi:maestro heat-like repeat family member 5 [Ornithorhynchus anatinus]|uniref:maestro heat-like repeat family member 5 n=1 Tax=Ornithorhynchus anatinus TaxID=9258 RepID=UPI0019D491DE|nr:maestro heat-like repeat family member 5 [Ornithorhynchus anatinus]